VKWAYICIQFLFLLWLWLG